MPQPQFHSFPPFLSVLGLVRVVWSIPGPVVDVDVTLVLVLGAGGRCLPLRGPLEKLLYRTLDNICPMSQGPSTRCPNFQCPMSHWPPTVK